MPVPNSIDDLEPVPADNYPAGSEPVFPNLDNYLRAHAAFIAQVYSTQTPMTGKVGAAILPEGQIAERPDPIPVAGLLMRGNKTTGNPEWYDRLKNAWVQFSSGGAFTAVPTTYAGQDISVESSGVLRYMRWDGVKYIPRQSADQQWLGVPVGIPFPLHIDAPKPRIDHPDFRYIELTAGITGAGGYNNGALVSETVSGSSPNIVATAVVNFVGSPINSKTVNLLNTSREFLRPGVASDVPQGSQNLSHSHQQDPNTLLLLNGAGWAYNAGNNNRKLGDATQLSGGDESRPRNVPAVYFMRIL